MNGEASQKSQPTSLFSSLTTTVNHSGAGSTISTTQLSTDSTALHQPSSEDSHLSDSKLSAFENGEPTDTNEGPSPEAESSEVATEDKDLEHDLVVADEQLSLESLKEEEGEVPAIQQIELLEHAPDIGDDGLELAPNELKRVKVYQLIGSRWMDQGTAFCFGEFEEETGKALLVARSERNREDTILSTVIRSTDVYQRQQDTLIVWTEPDGVDYALSFQDPEGCAEVWSFISDVQRHMNGSDDSSLQFGLESSVTTEGIIRSGYLPRPELGIIGEIERAIKTLTRTQSYKERICEFIQRGGYIKSMIEVMNTAEDLESLENLHALCSMMQTILMLNDHTMYEHILADDLFFGVVGMLEYDPDFPNYKANYREFLHQTSHFHQPVPIQDPIIERKIHHTYRLQFLKDVVLARALDDSTFNVLNSCIIFNQIDIISHVQSDPSFLVEIVKLFVDESMLNGPGSGPTPANATNNASVKRTPVLGQQQIPIIIGLGDSNSPPDKNSDPVPMDVDHKPSNPKLANGNTSPQVNGRSIPLPSLPLATRSGQYYGYAPPDDLSEEEIAHRREVILLVQQLCVMGKNVQLAARIALFRALVDRGILFAVQWAMSLPEREEVNKTMISAGGEVLGALLDHDLNGVRGHVLKQVLAIEKERALGKKGADRAETILEMACRLLAQSRELAVQSLIGDALKVWMDIPTAEPLTTAPAGTEASPALAALNKGPPRKDDVGTERYMDYFYKDCIPILFKPFHDLPEWRNVKESVLPLTAGETNRYTYLCDLLYNFVIQHHFRIHFYTMSNNVMVRVASLFKARDKHLRHAAFRIFRPLLRQNNQNTHVLIMKHDILKPILDLTIQESRRDNLLSCSCQEYFDTIRKEQITELGKFCMTKHEVELRILAQSLLGGQRFEQFIAWCQWEILQENKEPIPQDLKPEKVADTRGWPQGRLDTSEEDYFNGEDDEDDLLPAVGQSWPRIVTVGTPISNNLVKRRRRISVGSSPKGYRPPLRTPVLGSLVDYGEDEEEEGEDRDLLTKRQDTSRSVSPDVPPPASPKLSHRQVVRPPPGPPPPKRINEDDEEDNLLEALARSRSRPQSPAPGMMASKQSLRTSEKRRRDDDDDEMVERISRVKKSDLGTQKDKLSFGNLSRTKAGDDPPKKLKVKLGMSGLSTVASTPSKHVPSEPSAKDGDTG